MKANVMVSPDPAEVGTARRFVADTLNEMNCPPTLIEAAVLLTSEVVTNAVLHARIGEPRPDIGLTVVANDGVVRVEVRDESPTMPRPGQHDPDALSGRGLLLLDALASDWGADPDGDGGSGKLVWFELRT